MIQEPLVQSPVRPVAWGPPWDLSGVIGGVTVPDPAFFAPLTHSLIPTIGTGSASFTRADTHTVLDAMGVVRTVKSGEARFKRARRVENLVGADASENLTDAWWDDFGGAAVSLTADTMTLSSASPSHGLYSSAELTTLYGLNSTDLLTLSATITLVSGATDLDMYVGGLEKRITVSATPTRFSYTNDLSGDGYVGITRGSGDGVYTITNIQVEHVTGQANTSPGEHVTTDSGTDHGSGVVGVKYFNTQSANTVSAGGVVTELTGATITNCGLLMEQVKTNLVFPSADPSGFTLNNVTISAPGGSAAYLGGVQNNNIISSALTSDIEHSIGYTISVTDNDFVASVFATQSSLAGYIWIRATSDVDATTATQFFKLSDGTLGSPIGGESTLTIVSGTPQMEEVVVATGGGIGYRCSVVFNQLAATLPDNHTIEWGISDTDGDTSFSAPSQASIGNLTGFQVQIDHEVGEYIPTTAGTASTTGETLTYPVSNVTGIGESFSCSMDIITHQPSSTIGTLMRTLFVAGNGTYQIGIRNTNIIRVTQFEDTVGTETYRQLTSDLTTGDNSIGVTFSRTSTERITVLNGAEQTTPDTDDTDSSTWTPDRFEIGCSVASGTSQPEVIMKNLKLYEPLSLEQLKSIT